MPGLYVLKYPYRKVLHPAAKRLTFIHPDLLSYGATGITAGTAACYLIAPTKPLFLLVAVGLTLLRMTLNTLDGVIAIERGNMSPKGKIVNALPDRYSDIFLVGGIALSPICKPVYGLLGLASMFLVSYSGMLGKAVGVEWQHHGPLGKVERLILVMVFTLLQYLRLQSGRGTLTISGHSLTPMEWCMVAFVVLGQITVFNRVRGTLRQMVRHEWQAKAAEHLEGRRVLVAYDSLTGNTAKVAEAIAEPLRAELRRIGDVESTEGYDLVVLGTPNMGAKPSPRMLRFLKAHRNIGEYALFLTYGMPVWGFISAARCFSLVAELLGKEPLRTFSCKGFHAKAKTYWGHPTEGDLHRAYLFGMTLARMNGGRQ